MSLQSPPHPGRSVLLFGIEPCGLTVAEAAAHMQAAHMQVDADQLAAVCEARAPITADLAVRIDMAFGGNPAVWLQLQADHDLANAQERAEALRIERLDAVELDVAVGD